MPYAIVWEESQNPTMILMFAFMDNENEKKIFFTELNIDSYGTTIRSESPPQDVPPTPPKDGEVLLKRFLFNELKTATWNFHRYNKLGEGGFGSVFKGWVDDSSSTAAKPGTGMLIAVKRINQEGLQGHKEWLVSFTRTSLAYIHFFYD
ncbi:receptor-like cytoplasmic kinase 176 isoform X2 [Rosa chinensis]|uniref:receptor-like cytoplasmic kinase 176 isoform X2 n=1 Tax=Rosa chinensis TaxID=74649 RepID=UPI001AD93A2A|nr:receptor-like cytoplasmic kinase 176 isoform X2 [Rosa chinensis]